MHVKPNYKAFGGPDQNIFSDNHLDQNIPVRHNYSSLPSMTLLGSLQIDTTIFVYYRLSKAVNGAAHSRLL